MQLSCLPVSRIREHARTRTRPTAPPIHKYTQTHRHFPASPARGGLACLRGESGLAPRPLWLLPGGPSPAAPGSVAGCAPEWGEGWSRAAAGAARSSSPPPHAVPRPGRLCPMRSGVAGRWGVFLFWVEVEAEEREELATSSRRCRPRRGRWRRPRRSREVSPPRRRPLPAASLPPPGPVTPGPARGPSSLHSARRSARPRPHPPAP